MKRLFLIALATALLTACAQPKDGVDGVSSIIEVIDPCDDGPGYDEVLLRLSDGSILAYFESGNNRHLAEIDQGNYVTTDEQRCAFSVSGKPAVVTW